MHVPVTVWAISSISRVNVAILVLSDLMLVVDEWLAGLDDIVVDWFWRPVSVVFTIGLLIR